MSINIIRSLSSRPASVSNGQIAELALGLTTTISPTETAQITYRIGAPGVIFVSTGSPVLTTSEIVFSTGTTSRTQYALSGPPGAVPIRAEVTPATPPARSGTQVTLGSAIGLGASPTRAIVRQRAATASRGDDDEPREETGLGARRKRTTARKTTVRRRVRAGKRVARKTARSRKAKSTAARRTRKTAARTQSRTSTATPGKRTAAGTRSTTAKRSATRKPSTTRKRSTSRGRRSRK